MDNGIPYEWPNTRIRECYLALDGIPDPAAFMADVRRLVDGSKKLHTSLQWLGAHERANELFKLLTPFANMGPMREEGL